MTTIKTSLLCLVLLVLGAACSSQVTSRFLSSEELGVLPTSFDAIPEQRTTTSRGPCYEQDNYRIDTTHLDHYPMRYLRVNIHWMNSADSSQNIPEAAAIAYSERIIFAMNYALNKNVKMYLLFVPVFILLILTIHTQIIGIIKLICYKIF